VLVIDDHPVVAESVAATLRSIDRAAVLDQAHSLRGALQFHQRGRQFDILVVDLSLPDSRGVATLERLKEAWPQAQMVVFSGIDNVALRQHCLSLGTLAFVTKSEDVQALHEALRQALTRYAPARKAASAASERPLRFELTPKQQLVWQDLAAGYSNAEIGQRHGIGLNTVKTHVREVLERVGARNRTEAARLYFESH
jgi:DNA-binding NarL/FixJ family response regulator